MKKKFEELEPFKQRLVKEYNELDEKLTKLITFMNSEAGQAMSESDDDKVAEAFYLMNQQACAMQLYEDVLSRRLDLYGLLEFVNND